ncbi:Hypothetical protein A7982_11329 [Minicystis rosea]|nr:Hypothetical protein A7982_11329 [Minicystis rosea]
MRLTKQRMTWFLIAPVPLLAVVLGAISCVGSEPMLPNLDGGISSDASTCPFTQCDGICTDTRVDSTNCGACGQACNPGEVCVEGACAVSCPADQTKCGSSCIATNVDAQNCGACGHACNPGEVCAAGTCALSCAANQTKCDIGCVDTAKDIANCGSCGHACNAGEVCVESACAVSCPPNQTQCDTACVDTAGDPANCGSCGHACGAGEVCLEGACAVSCPPTQTQCGTACIDTAVDSKNCGACGHACGAGEVCTGGACAVSCPPTQTQCGAACIDTAVDSKNCGACGHVCAPGQLCASGACALTCPATHAMCEGGTLCVDLQTSNAHCGACGAACPVGRTCVSGQCSLVCEAGRILCSEPVTTDAGTSQVCVDPTIDVMHCGNCGTMCDAGQFCSGGTCAHPTSCADVLAHTGPVADGPRTIQPVGKKPFTVHCAGMNTTSPKEYLTLAFTRNNGSTSNYSSFSCSNCTDKISRYFEKIRINPATLVVDRTDSTFATNVTNTPTCWAGAGGACGAATNLSYALAGNCILNGAAAPGNIDLHGLPFSLDPSVTFTLKDDNPYGSATISTDRKKVDLTGGGSCGGMSPSGALLLKQD